MEVINLPFPHRGVAVLAQVSTMGHVPHAYIQQRSAPMVLLPNMRGCMSVLLLASDGGVVPNAGARLVTSSKAEMCDRRRVKDTLA